MMHQQRLSAKTAILTQLMFYAVPLIVVNSMVIVVKLLFG